MNRYITIFVLLLLVFIVGLGAIFLLHPSNPTAFQQQIGQYQPISTTVSVSASDPLTQAVQTAYRNELAKHESDNTKLYEISIIGDYALQAWAGDIMGGEALLKYDRTQDQWVLLDGGGGAWSVDVLASMGVPTSTAESLIAGMKR